jgi:GNAT superfamily N-acetyltransferase
MARHDVVIQLARPDFKDWDALHRLLVTCFAYMEGRIDPPSSLTRMPPEVLATKAAEETLVTAVSNGILVGCGFLSETPDTIYIGKLAVAAPFRRKGILKALISEAERVARGKGKAFLELQTRVELIENHRTFEALGFAKVGETAHAGFARATSITMRKPIAPAMAAPIGARGHNGGPELDDHVPEWGRAGVRRYFVWKAARKAAFTVSAGAAVRRARKARACGVSYDEYTSYLLDTGRYLQPENTDAIAAIKARRST